MFCFWPVPASCRCGNDRELRGENVELRVQLLKLHDGAVNLKQVTDTVTALQRTVADLVQELRAQRMAATNSPAALSSTGTGASAGVVTGAGAAAGVGHVGVGAAPTVTPNPFPSPASAPQPSTVDDAVSRALFKKRVTDAVQTAQTDNSPEVFAKGVSTLEMVLGNIVKNPLVPRYGSPRLTHAWTTCARYARYVSAKPLYA